MERSKLALLAAASLVLSAGAWAQQPAPRGAPETGQAQVIEVSDADLEKFADIYVDLLDIQAKFEKDVAGAQTEDEARQVEARAQQDSVARLAHHGWTAERYVLVGEAIKSNPELTEKTVELIEDRD